MFHEILANPKNCLKAQQESDQLRHDYPDMFYPQCDQNGDYAREQSDSQGQIFCADPHDGRMLVEGPCEPKPGFQSSDDKTENVTVTRNNTI